MRTGRGRRGWTRARGSSLPGLHSLAPTGRSAGAAGLSQGTGRRMVGRNGLLHPDGAYPQLRRGPAHPLEGNPCRTRMRRGRSRAFTAIMGGKQSVRFRGQTVASGYAVWSGSDACYPADLLRLFLSRPRTEGGTLVTVRWSVSKNDVPVGSDGQAKNGRAQIVRSTGKSPGVPALGRYVPCSHRRSDRQRFW